jgi:hypothetical protein
MKISTLVKALGPIVAPGATPRDVEAIIRRTVAQDRIATDAAPGEARPFNFEALREMHAKLGALIQSSDAMKGKDGSGSGLGARNLEEQDAPPAQDDEEDDDTTGATDDPPEFEGKPANPERNGRELQGSMDMARAELSKRFKGYDRLRNSNPVAAADSVSEADAERAARDLRALIPGYDRLSNPHKYAAEQQAKSDREFFGK